MKRMRIACPQSLEQKQMSANERSGQLLVVVKHIQRKRPQGDIISKGNTQKILHPTLSYR